MQTFCLIVCKHFIFLMYECGTKVTEYLFLFKCFCFIATHDYLFCPMCKQVCAGCEVRGQYMIILSALLC